MKEHLDRLNKHLEQAKKMHQESQQLAKQALNSMPESKEKQRLIRLQKELENCEGDAMKIQKVIEQLTKKQ